MSFFKRSISRDILASSRACLTEGGKIRDGSGFQKEWFFGKHKGGGVRGYLELFLQKSSVLADWPVPKATKLFAIQFSRNMWNVKNLRKKPFLSLFCFTLLLPRFPNFHFMLSSLDHAASFSHKSISPPFFNKPDQDVKKEQNVCETHSGAGTSRWTPSLWKMLKYRKSTQSIS